MRIIASLLIGVFLFISCAASHSFRPPGESLEESVKVYWNARVKNEPRIAYIYENMSLDKKYDLELYTKNFYRYNVAVTEFQMVEAGKEGSGPRGTTPVKMRLKMKLSLEENVIKWDENRMIEATDYWKKNEDGKWYHMIQHLTGNMI
jgi:hypothetical protein